MLQQRSSVSCRTVWGAEPHVRPDILGRCDHLLQDRGRTLGAPPRRVGAIHGARFEIEAVQM